MITLIVQTTKRKEIIDITNKINSLLKKEINGEGICFLFVMHTTCALTTADLDPGTDLDYLKAIEKMFPKADYQHPHDPFHVGDHIMSSLIGASVVLPVKKGQLTLGTWQKVILIELTGPRKRNISYNFFATR